MSPGESFPRALALAPSLLSLAVPALAALERGLPVEVAQGLFPSMGSLVPRQAGLLAAHR